MTFFCFFESASASISLLLPCNLVLLEVELSAIVLRQTAHLVLLGKFVLTSAIPGFSLVIVRIS